MVDALETACDRLIAHFPNAVCPPVPPLVEVVQKKHPTHYLLLRGSSSPQPRLALDSPSAVVPPEVHHRNARSTRIFYPYLTPNTRYVVSGVGGVPFSFKQRLFERGCRVEERLGNGRRGMPAGLCRPVREDLHRRESLRGGFPKVSLA